jgi:hypothetical protein
VYRKKNFIFTSRVFAQRSRQWRTHTHNVHLPFGLTNNSECVR